MHLDELADHLKMAEFLQGDILEHIADARILDMEGLNPIGQSRGQLAGRAAELLEEFLAECGIGRVALNV